MPDELLVSQARVAQLLCTDTHAPRVYIVASYAIYVFFVPGKCLLFTRAFPCPPPPVPVMRRLHARLDSVPKYYSYTPYKQG